MRYLQDSLTHLYHSLTGQTYDLSASQTDLAPEQSGPNSQPRLLNPELQQPTARLTQNQNTHAPTNTQPSSFVKMTKLLSMSWLSAGAALSNIQRANAAHQWNVSDEFLVNSITTGDQTRPSIDSWPMSDEFIVVWRSNHTGDWDVYARHFLNSTHPISQEFRVNGGTTNDQLSQWRSVAVLSNGNYVIGWYGTQSGSPSCYQGVYDQSDTALPRAYTITSYPSPQYGSINAALLNGRYLTIGYYLVSSYYATFATLFDASSTNITQLGASFRVDPDANYTNWWPYPIALKNGGFAVSWVGKPNGNYDIMGRFYNSNYNLIGPVTTFNSETAKDQLEISGVAFNSGDVLFAWTSNQFNNTYNIFARRYSITGIAKGDDFKVSVQTSGHEHTPTLTRLASDDYLIAWAGNITGKYDIYIRHFNQNDEPYAEEFKINGNKLSASNNPVDMTTLLEGNKVVVVWHGSQASDYNIYGRVLTKIMPSTNTSINSSQTTLTTPITPIPSPSTMPESNTASASDLIKLVTSPAFLGISISSFFGLIGTTFGIWYKCKNDRRKHERHQIELQMLREKQEHQRRELGITQSNYPNIEMESLGTSPRQGDYF